MGFAALLILSLFKSGIAAPKTGAPGKKAIAAEKAAEQLAEALRLGEESREALDAIEDYTASFTKIERVGDGIIEQTMELKLRHQPFSVYLRFRSANERGREVIYVAGANDGRLLVQQPGVLGALAGTHRLKIDEWPVSLENRYPITEIGVSKILEKALMEWQPGDRAPPKSATFRISEEDVGGVPCRTVEVEQKRSSSKKVFSLSRVYFSKKSKLPVRAEQYGWPQKNGGKRPLLEVYDYRDIRVNVGLTDADFAPTNPSYGFKGF